MSQNFPHDDNCKLHHKGKAGDRASVPTSFRYRSRLILVQEPSDLNSRSEEYPVSYIREDMTLSLFDESIVFASKSTSKRFLFALTDSIVPSKLRL